MRSKKSMAWKAKQGTMKSVFSNEKGKDRATSKFPVPDEFRDAAVKFMQDIREGLNPNEVRALAANKVASPVLQVSHCADQLRRDRITHYSVAAVVGD